MCGLGHYYSRGEAQGGLTPLGFTLRKVRRETQGVVGRPMGDFAAQAKEVAQRGAAEDSGTGDPSFCRTY